MTKPESSSLRKHSLSLPSFSKKTWTQKQRTKNREIWSEVWGSEEAIGVIYSKTMKMKTRVWLDKWVVRNKRIQKKKKLQVWGLQSYWLNKLKEITLTKRKNELRFLEDFERWFWCFGWTLKTLFSESFFVHENEAAELEFASTVSKISKKKKEFSSYRNINEKNQYTWLLLFSWPNQNVQNSEKKKKKSKVKWSM